MNELLQKAIDCLKISDVYLRNSLTSVTEGFEPKYELQNSEFSLQLKHRVERSEILKLENDGDREQLILRVLIDLGARWVIGKEDSPEELVKVEAQFLAEYAMTGPLEQAAIDQFAMKNASYHVWPYWREYLMSTSLRMNLPKLAVPAVQLAHNRFQADTEATRPSSQEQA